MSVGGIGGSHVGQTSSMRMSNTLSNIGSVAFNATMTAAQVGATAFGGPGAGAAVSAVRSGVSGALGNAGVGTGGSIDGLGQEVRGNVQQQMAGAAADTKADQMQQVQLLRLQSAVNASSQTNNMMTNMQKSRHDAMMATIQNAR